MSQRLLRRASRRSWTRQPLQLALSVLGVALGVAVALSVDLANESARRAFRVSTEAVTGRTTHQIVAGSAGLPEDLYREIRVELGFRRSAPVVEGWVTAPGGGSLRLLGVDPLAESGVRDPLAANAVGGAIELGAILSRALVLATEETLADLGVEAGADLVVRAEGRPFLLRMAGRLEPAEGLARRGLRGVLVADLATAQVVLGRRGRLDRIDLVEPEEDVLAAIATRLPGDARVLEAAARADSTLEMTRAFALNLQAMSLLALVCGVFLIYNTMTFSVVRRRPLIGLLRAQGVTRTEIFRAILREAAVIGAVGTALGLVLGRLLAGGMVALVTRTINDLYFRVAVAGVEPALESLVRAGGLGIGATLLAALAPAREATRTQPRAALQRSEIEQRTRTLSPRLARLGVGFGLAGAAILWLPTNSLSVAFGGLFALLFGAALVTPLATATLAGGCAPLLRRAGGLLGALAARSVVANLSRTSVAVAALMIAVSVIIGVGTMVGSFRTSLVGWLDYTLQADLYVAPTARDPGTTLALPEGLRRRLLAEPGVEGVGSIRVLELVVEHGSLQLMALEPSPSARDSYDLVSGDPATAWARFAAGAALVSEPYAHRHDIEPGDRLTLPTPSGPLPTEVVGVFRSYASDRGAVMIHRETYDAAWDEPGVSGLSIELGEAADPAGLRALLEDAFAGIQQVAIVSNGELRRESLAIFDRTFLITTVLRVLVSLVAFVGVFAALMAMALERTRELGILRATGLTPRQLFALVTGQTGLLGLIAGVLAMPLGLALAWVMIHVINRRSFGWSLDMQVGAGDLGEALAIAVTAALLAGIWPAIRSARLQPAAAVREE